MPVLVYALFGSSKQLSVGPVAVTSLLIGSSLKALVPGAEDITNPNKLTPEQVRAAATALLQQLRAEAAHIAVALQNMLQLQIWKAMRVASRMPRCFAPPVRHPLRTRTQLWLSCCFATLGAHTRPLQPQSHPAVVRGGRPVHGRRLPAPGLCHVLPQSLGYQRLHQRRLNHHRSQPGVCLARVASFSSSSTFSLLPEFMYNQAHVPLSGGRPITY